MNNIIELDEYRRKKKLQEKVDEAYDKIDEGWGLPLDETEKDEA